MDDNDDNDGDEDELVIHREGGGKAEKRKNKKQKTNKPSIPEMGDSHIEEPKRDKKKSKKIKSISLNAVESLVAFAQASGKERPPPLEDLVVRIRLEDLHHENEWHVALRYSATPRRPVQLSRNEQRQLRYYYYVCYRGKTIVS